MENWTDCIIECSVFGPTIDEWTSEDKIWVGAATGILKMYLSLFLYLHLKK